MIAIVGAGAAGLATAIFAVRRGVAGPIVLFDGAVRPGAKILVSGGSRCNVTNREVTERDFAGGSPRVVRRVLREFPASQAADFFREIGVALHEEAEGKLFPDSGRSRTVLDALLAELGRRGVELRAGGRVHGLTALGRPSHGLTSQGDDARTDVAPTGGFRLETSRGPVEARRVVLATGGLSLPKTGSDGAGYAMARGLGHTIVPPVPALVPLVLAGSFHARLAGVSHEAEVSVRVEGERPVVRRGSLLWTHFGASGPVVLDVSRFWHRAVEGGKTAHVSGSFLPGRRFEDVESELLARGTTSPQTQVGTALGAWLPASVAAAVPDALGVGAETRLGRLTRDDRRRLVRSLLDWPLDVTGSRGYGFAEVTAGGVPLDEIDPATMASRRCPGLSLVGEILDVDGRIGGFNFQWAWSSAWVAAGGLAREGRGGPGMVGSTSGES